MSPPQVHHLYECLHKDIPYNPAQIDQFTQIQEPDLPEFLYHMDEDEDPVPCFAMTNPYEAILTHDPSRSCVRITPDMLHSLKPQEDIVKLLYKYHIGTMRVHIDSNQSIIKIINNTEETIHYTPQLDIGIVDIRSLGYYNVSKSIVFFDKRGNDRIPPPPYRVPKLHPCNYYKAKEMKEQSIQESEKEDPYPWLDKDDPIET